MRGLGIGLPAVLCVGLGAGTALAQSAPSAGAFGDGAAPAPSAAAPKSAAPDAAPADVVRLKNGGLLRGNISELVPGGTVTIVTMTGGTRVFNMSEVAYAGPAAQDPQAAPAQPPAAAPPAAAPPAEHKDLERWDQQPKEGQQPYVTVHAAEARIHFSAPDENTTFYRRSGAAYAEGHYGWARVSSVAKGYERICTAPCEASLPAGKETLAFAHDDDEPKELDPVRLPAGLSEARLSIKVHTGLHIAGFVTMFVGTVVGATFLYFQQTQEHSTDTDLWLVGGVAAGFGIGAGLGIPLAKVKDTPQLEMVPSASSARRLDQARGVTFSGHF